MPFDLIPEPLPQVIRGLPFEDYLALPAISSHGLMLIERSPAHYRAAIEAPREPTQAQALGTLTHLLVLEPERHGEVRVAPEVDRRTKAGKEAWAEFQAESAGRLVVTQDQWDRGNAMAEAVYAQPYARALLEDGEAEVSMLFEVDGVRCKARADWICGGHAALLDLKTAADASPDEFSRAAGRYRYATQAAFYQDAAEACGMGRRSFIHLVVENEPPYGVALYQLDEESLRVGRIRYRHALETYRECQASGQWPGYATQIQHLSLPKWAL